MTDIEIDEEVSDRVAETVRRALALVGPAESSVPERVTPDRGDQSAS